MILTLGASSTLDKGLPEPCASSEASFCLKIRAPGLGSPERVWSDFVPISSVCSDVRSLFSGIRRLVLIYSDFVRFLPICCDYNSEQIRTNQGNPFLPTRFGSS